MTPNVLSSSKTTGVEYKSHIQTKEVDRLLKEGKKRSEIAKLLNAKPSAVDYHLAKIRHGWPKQIQERSKVDYNKYINWRVYNEGLVKRGEVLLDFDIFKDWAEELEGMNQGKVGAPYEYPESFIKFLLRFKMCFHIGYRQTEGIGRKLVVFIPQAKNAPDYTTLQNRFEAMPVALTVYQAQDEQDIAQDSSGIKTSNRGEYKTLKYDREKKKEYVKIHIAVNIQTQEVVGLEVTLSNVHDSQVVGNLIRQAQEVGRIRKSMMDSGYDSKKVYQLDMGQGIEPIIKPSRKGTLKGARRRLAKLQKKKEMSKLGPEELAEIARLKVLIEYLQEGRLWKKRTGYGLRWYSEGHFSAFKRVLGEYVFSRKYENMVKELKFKCSLMNLFKFISRGYRIEEIPIERKIPA